MGATVLIVCALRFEARALLPYERDHPDCLTVGVTGVGPNAAREGLRQFVESYHPSWIVGCGLCGGLELPFKCGDIVVPRYFVSDEDELVLEAAKLPYDLLVGLESITHPYRETGLFAKSHTDVRMLSVRHAVATTEEKRVFRQQYEAKVVDQESHAWCKMAQELGIPFVAIRVLLDDAHARLPSWRDKRSWPQVFTLPGKALRSRRVLREVGRQMSCVRW